MAKAPTRQRSGPSPFPETHWAHDPNKPVANRKQTLDESVNQAQRMALRASHSHRGTTPETHWPGENKQLVAINGQTPLLRQIGVG